MLSYELSPNGDEKDHKYCRVPVMGLCWYRVVCGTVRVTQGPLYSCSSQLATLIRTVLCTHVQISPRDRPIVTLYVARMMGLYCLLFAVSKRKGMKYKKLDELCCSTGVLCILKKGYAESRESVVLEYLYCTDIFTTTCFEYQVRIASRCRL
jgi:hypothetical protein